MLCKEFRKLEPDKMYKHWIKDVKIIKSRMVIPRFFIQFHPPFLCSPFLFFLKYTYISLLKKKIRKKAGMKIMTFSPNNHNQQQIQNDQRKPHHLNKSLAVNMDYLKKRIGNSTDVIFRSIKIGHKLALQLTIVYVEGIADDKKIDQYLGTTEQPTF
jgi:hypothetical protein